MLFCLCICYSEEEYKEHLHLKKIFPLIISNFIHFGKPVAINDNLKNFSWNWQVTEEKCFSWCFWKSWKKWPQPWQVNLRDLQTCCYWGFLLWISLCKNVKQKYMMAKDYFLFFQCHIKNVETKIAKQNT